MAQVILVTAVGDSIISARLIGNPSAQTEPLWASWGTGAGVASKGATTLSTESRSQATSGGNVIRTLGTSSQQTTSTTNDSYQVIATITSDAGKTITNVGLFDTNGAVASPGPPSGGNLFFMADSLSVLLANNDAIQFTLKVVNN